MVAVTVILQGRYGEETSDAIAEYSKVAPVILSCYPDDISKIPPEIADRCQNIILNKIDVGKSYNSQNIYYQSATTLSGLKLCTSPFAVKVRTDEKFSHIERVLDCILSNPDKILTTNYIFRNTSYCVYHFSDHMIGGRTDVLTRAFSRIEWRLRTGNYIIDEINNTLLPCELWLSTTILQTLGCYIGKDNAVENMRNHMCMVPVQDLAPFVLRFNTKGRIFTNPDEIFVDEHFHLRRTIDEYIDN